MVCATVALANPPGETVPHETSIRFVPAAASGMVSLGIYDRQGALVRVLCDEWPFSRFRIGLNGLSTSWDGNDDAGQSVAAGTYTARGFVVGDIAVSGEANPDAPVPRHVKKGWREVNALWSTAA